jgi:methyl-accepting chemotaxis protein
MTIAPEKQPQQRRRIKLINRDFQIGLIVKFIVANATVLALFGAVMYLFLRGEIQSNLQSAHATYRTVGAMLLPIVMTLSLLVLAILSVSIVFVVLYASHRIAGPMYRFHHALLEMADGNLKALTRIREDDQLGEVAVALETVRERWSGDVASLRQVTDSVVALLRDNAPAATVREKVSEAEAILDRYRG